MDAIYLNNVARPHRYACAAILVNPDPPQVGVTTNILLHLKNPSHKPITISRIETMVAQFGMGVRWEQLPAVGPFQLPADQLEEITIQWTPLKGGHRCIRAAIHIETIPEPLRVGRNLHVIESEAERTIWRVPFRLGNPEDRRMAIVLEVGGNMPDQVEAHLLVHGRVVRPGEPIWLAAGEEVDGRLLLHARTDEALKSINTVEATIGGRFLDGIQVEIYRPARIPRTEHTFAPSPGFRGLADPLVMVR